MYTNLRLTWFSVLEKNMLVNILEHAKIRIKYFKYMCHILDLKLVTSFWYNYNLEPTFDNDLWSSFLTLKMFLHARYSQASILL